MAWFEPEKSITWEPAATLPRCLIDEFEKGTAREELVDDSRYGVQSHTMVISGRETDKEPPAKRVKLTQFEKGYGSLGQSILTYLLSPNKIVHNLLFVQG